MIDIVGHIRCQCQFWAACDRCTTVDIGTGENTTSDLNDFVERLANHGWGVVGDELLCVSCWEKD